MFNRNKDVSEDPEKLYNNQWLPEIFSIKNNDEVLFYCNTNNSIFSREIWFANRLNYFWQKALLSIDTVE